VQLQGIIVKLPEGLHEKLQSILAWILTNKLAGILQRLVGLSEQTTASLSHFLHRLVSCK
jgi:hypothetical protein